MSDPRPTVSLVAPQRSKRTRNTEVQRGKIKAIVARALWAKAGGCCVICSSSVLTSHWTLHSVLVGELAHNVGATATEGSPRGQDEDVADREAEENLLLLCHGCHRLIDDEDHVPYFSTERLRSLKKIHEDRVRLAATSGGMRRTAILRVGGQVRGAAAMASQRQTADALLTDGYLGHVDSRFKGDFECRIAGDPSRVTYWDAAQEEIGSILDQINQATSSGDVDHLSIFAIAPIPLLVYLGSRLDDKTDTRLYQKHRDAAQGWQWDESTDIRDFATNVARGRADATDVILTASITAEVHDHLIPDSLRGEPRFDIRLSTNTFGPSIISHPSTLLNFAQRWREMLAAAEVACPRATRWHLIAAAPVTVALEMGRAFMHGAQPPVAVYERHNGTYEDVLTVNT